MANFTVGTDTRGSFFFLADASTIDWLYVSGSVYTAPPGEYALTISLQDFTPGALDPSISRLTLTTWATGSPVVLLTFEARGYIDNVFSNGGSDHIIGTDGLFYGNYLQGDDIYEFGGDDWIEGRAGNDTLMGVGGSDRLYGGDNNDRLYGDWDRDDQDQGNFAEGSDSSYGGAGDDTIYGSGGTNLVDGGIGRDTLTYLGFFHNEGARYYCSINLTNGQATVFGVDLFDGSTYVVASDTISDVEHLIGTEGNDTIGSQVPNSVLFPEPIWVEGSYGDDLLLGGIYEDQLYGDQGNDTLYSGGQTAGVGGPDFLVGGSGNDVYVLASDSFLQELVAGGRDRVEIGYNTAYTLLDTFEDLTLLSSAGAASGTGNAEANTILGNGFANTLRGLNGDDVLNGVGGNDTLVGGIGADRIFGASGNDLLQGNSGNDILNGGTGNDTLSAGTGRDNLTGGDGRDLFIFSSAADLGLGSTRDSISDFVSGQDRIRLDALQAGQTVTIGGAFTGDPGEIRYNQLRGILSGDLDGDRIADWQLSLGAGNVLAVTDILV